MTNKDTDKTAAASKATTPTPRGTEINSITTPAPRTADRSANFAEDFDPPPPVTNTMAPRDSELDRMFDTPTIRKPSRDGIVRLRVSTQQGIPSRRRGLEFDETGALASATFTPTPRTVVVDEENARIILEDKGLVAYRVNGAGEITGVPAEAEIQSMRTEIEHLRAHNADLATENASLHEENRRLRIAR